MYKLPTAAITVATLCLLFASPVTLAGEILVIDEKLDVLPPGYQLREHASSNATAEFQIGNLGVSNGLIFDGSWDVPANGTEHAAGDVTPILHSPADYQVDPRAIKGIASIRWTLDARVSSETMVPEQGIFAQLIIFQEQADGKPAAFSDKGNFVEVGQSVSFDITVTESDFGTPGDRPDLSATGRPISFGLQFGATYPETTNPDKFYVEGRMTGNNWTVAITDGGSIFSDGFEPEAKSSVMAERVERAAKADCSCPAPPPLNQ